MFNGLMCRRLRSLLVEMIHRTNRATTVRKCSEVNDLSVTVAAHYRTSEKWGRIGTTSTVGSCATALVSGKAVAAMNRGSRVMKQARIPLVNNIEKGDDQALTRIDGFFGST